MVYKKIEMPKLQVDFVKDLQLHTSTYELQLGTSFWNNIGLDFAQNKYQDKWSKCFWFKNI